MREALSGRSGSFSRRAGAYADFDAIVIGSGPNGLAGACVLARSGLRVLVLEANPARAGGAVGSVAATRPGFVHDVGAAFFAWGKLSPAFRDLSLGDHGLRWAVGEIESCHPAPDGTYAAISRDHDVTARHFGSVKDGERWREVATWYGKIEPNVIDFLMKTFPATGPLVRLLPVHIAKLASIFLSRGAALARRWFESEAARRVLPGLALHVDVGPDDWFGAALGFMLGMTATTGGYAVPVGGAQSIADAMVRDLLQHGGWLQLGARVRRVLVQDDRACGVVLTDGTEITARAIVADTDVATLLLDLVEREHVPGRVLEFMQRYPRGWGTFKVDWALAKPVPWTCELAGKAAVVHAGDSLADLSRFTAQVRAGALPDNPYLVIGQQSLLDPSRAPAGQHTLWAYSRVPPRLPAETAGTSGWAAHAEHFADRIDARIEALAPGFRKTILERRL
ncbi:MAG TPA: NAD(P)/FAD-dependent oxidoreductase, partial [Nannocystaceae bacterium]|nr:NAD(P)/FAD-dependent oxidoreductase [Nannocystaceae bacterium]